MTDDEISEFAEALHWACEESGHVGTRCSQWCPLGALAFPETRSLDRRRPTPSEAAEELWIPVTCAESFIHGYDDRVPSVRGTDEPRIYNLGRQFREMYP